MPKGSNDRELRSKKKESSSTTEGEEMETIEKSLFEINRKLEDLNKKMNKSEVHDKEIREKIGNIEDFLNELADMRKEMDNILAENRSLKDRIIYLESETKKIKTEKIATSIEIYGIPYEEGEDTKSLIRNLAEKAKINLREGDLIDSFRPRNVNNRERPIKAKLISIKIKNEIVKALKESKFRLGDINKRPENKKIYANEATLPETKRLLHQTKEQLIKMNWDRAWIYARDVYIYLRNENDQRIRLNNKEVLKIFIK